MGGKIGNNTFIGSGTVIHEGITIGNNVIVGAGSIIDRNLPNDTNIANSIINESKLL